MRCNRVVDSRVVMRRRSLLQRRIVSGLTFDDSFRPDSISGAGGDPLAAVQRAHERYNKGIYRELTAAEMVRDRLSSSQKLHISRYLKPTVKGFQAYVQPQQHRIEELCWVRSSRVSAASADGGLQLVPVSELQKGEAAVDHFNPFTAATCHSSEPSADALGEEDDDPAAAWMPQNDTEQQQHLATLTLEFNHFQRQRGHILRALEEATESMVEAISEELMRKRQQYGAADPAVGSLFSAAAAAAGHSSSLFPDLRMEGQAEVEGNEELVALGSSASSSLPVPAADQLVNDMLLAQESGFKPLSQLSALFDPLQLRVVLYEDEEEGMNGDSASEDSDATFTREAFQSTLIHIPAAADNVSFSLYVAGGLLMDERLAVEFPYHLSRFFITPGGGQQGEGEGMGKARRRSKSRGKKRGGLREAEEAASQGASPPPAAQVEVFFSAELYRIAKVIGMSGVRSLRDFVGKAMQSQHRPTAVSPSLLLNSSAGRDDSNSGGSAQASSSCLAALLSPSPSICIRWQLPDHSASTASKFGVHRGITSSPLSLQQVGDLHEDGDEDTEDRKRREVIQSIWRTWGHLVKDLHVTGDTEFLYVSIEQRQEQQEAAAYVEGVRVWAANTVGEATGKSTDLTVVEPASSAVANPSVEGEKKSTPAIRRKRALKGLPPAPRYIPLPTIFTVIECVLEKRGLPHHMVLEDITELLKEMQQQSTAMMRLAVMDEWALQQQQQEGGGDEGSGDPSQLMPMVYAPSVVVSHTGRIDAMSSSRGDDGSDSCGAHTFQRIRIRGSQLAHVEALALALDEGRWRRDGTGLESAYLSGEEEEGGLKPNLSYTPVCSTGKGRGYSGMLPQPRRGSASRGRSIRATEGATPSTALGGDEVDTNRFDTPHYYKIRNIRLVFLDRVEASDLQEVEKKDDEGVAAPSPVATRLQSALTKLSKLIESAPPVSSGQKEGGGGPRRSKSSKRGAGSSTAAQHTSTITPQRVFQQMCVDAEEEAMRMDLQPSFSNCTGYQHCLKLQRVRDEEQPAMLTAIHSLERKGFINYVSPHRFSSFTAFHRHPGFFLLKGQFQAAASVIVQQCYVDAALESERKSSKLLFSSQLMVNQQRASKSFPDGGGWGNRGGSRQTILHSATPIQKVLFNALHASQWVAQQRAAAYQQQDPTEVAAAFDEEEQPCADAFLNVLGPYVCRTFVQEFVSFLWNDLVNQRLQRYGSFTVLPGDLVRVASHHPDWLPSNLVMASTDTDSPSSSLPPGLMRATKKAIQTQSVTPWDVVLPVPGSNMLLPENHTADLYVITLKRLGIPFHPEKQQFDIFDAPPEGWVPEQQPGVPPSSPYNALGYAISSYARSLLIQPCHPAYHWKASYHPGNVGDPYQRWGAAVLQALEGGGGASAGLTTKRSSRPLTLAPSPTSAVPTSSSSLVTTSSSGAIPLTPAQQAAARRRSSLPSYPYWYPQHNDGSLELNIRLPVGVCPHMLVRELLKSDVSSSDVVQLAEDYDGGSRVAPSSSASTAPATDQEKEREAWRQRQRRRVSESRPVASSLALLHQLVFRSSGVRRSLLPTLRTYDSLGK